MHGGFPVNAKRRKKIERRKRRIARRLDRDDNRGCQRPILTAFNIHYEIADRTRATVYGGIVAMHVLARKQELDQTIDRHLGLLKIHLACRESDHVPKHRLQPVGQGNLPGAPGVAAQRRGLPRRLGGPPHSRPAVRGQSHPAVMTRGVFPVIRDEKAWRKEDA